MQEYFQALSRYQSDRLACRFDYSCDSARSSLWCRERIFITDLLKASNLLSFEIHLKDRDDKPQNRTESEITTVNILSGIDTISLNITDESFDDFLITEETKI